jgi:predicted ATPase
VTAQIVAKTDGVPLFVEELTKTVLEGGLLVAGPQGWRLDGPLPPFAIPATLHDSLAARLDRLAPVKEIAQIGAAIGREFSYALLRAVAGRDEPALRAALAQLEEAELLFRTGMPPDARYTFKHALVQDTAYETLLRSRRQILHRQIADALRGEFPAVEVTEPELVGPSSDPGPCMRAPHCPRERAICNSTPHPPTRSPGPSHAPCRYA